MANPRVGQADATLGQLLAVWGAEPARYGHALGYGVGRIACQPAGDGTYGVASQLPWAMSYPHGEAPTTERVHPTPVYETLASLLIFWLLWRVCERLAPMRLFGVYLLLAGAERSLVELIRRNDEVLAGLTQPQLFSIALMAAGRLTLAARTNSRRDSHEDLIRHGDPSAKTTATGGVP